MKLSSRTKKYLLCALSFIVIFTLLKISWGPATKVLTKNVASSTTTNSINTVLNKSKSSDHIQYVQVIDSCNATFESMCVNVRSAPSLNAPVIFKARNGIVLKVSGTITKDGMTWYKISFDEWLRYPNRVEGELYISENYLKIITDIGIENLTSSTSSTNKRIIVDRSEQTLYAYENDTLFMKEKVSTGIELTPTPRGNFTVFRKTPTRYMQGPIPEISDHYYDLPGVPWNLYFTEQGAVIHGAYWHNNFGKQWSNGCVNMSIESAEKLYRWAEVGTKVTVRD